jgi:glycosyltransferase involved in cell wall biosynthesis
VSADPAPRADGPGVHHVVVGDGAHGVTGVALALSAGRPRTRIPALQDPDDARAARALLPDPAVAPLLHLHLTDNLLGSDPVGALRVLTADRRVAVTLHDVPQAAEGAARFRRRAELYVALGAAADLVAVCSAHERDGLRALGGTADHVLPLAIDARLVPGAPGPEPTVGVLGWLYPGKGHAELAALLAGLGRPTTLVALGAVSAGHDGLDDELAAHCAALGVGFRCTGYLDDMTLLHEAARVAVPVLPHRHVSASASLGSWMSAGRRPVVAAGGYARETAARLPGALTVTDDLAAAVAAALDDPASTVLPADVPVGPTTTEAAAAQDAVLAAWAAGSGSAEHPA